MQDEPTEQAVPIEVTEVVETPVEDVFRREDETQAEYNERISPAVQPVVESPKVSYLGEPL